MIRCGDAGGGCDGRDRRGARLRLREVDALVDQEKWQDAVARTRSVKTEFRGLPIAREARDREEKYAEDHDGYKAVLDEYKKEDKAAELLLRAVGEIRSRRFGPAFKKLETILRDFDNTEGAEYAKPIKKRMEENPRVMAEVQRQGGGRCRPVDRAGAVIHFARSLRRGACVAA